MTGVPWDAAAAAALGIDWLVAASAPAGEFGRRRRAAERAFVPGDEIAVRASIEAVVRVAGGAGAESLEALRMALAAAPDPNTALARAAAGDVLGDVDFFELNRFLDALAGVRAAAAGEAFEGVALPAGDADLAAVLAPGRTAQRGFYLDDAFGSDLAAARTLANDRQAAYDSARSALGARVARALGLDHLRDGEFTLLRAGLRGPLPPEVRVLREAPTYLACELALDEAALAALEARDAAAARVAEAEEAVRARLSRIVGESASHLRGACDALGELDAFVGRARFAQRYACVVPEIADRRDAFSFDFARYLPLAESLAASGRAYVPISLRLDGTAVVTGPNMGGKTAALRTCGFLAACVVLGLPIPASAASVPLFDEIAWVGVARGEHEEATSERQLLSAFGAEVIVLRDMLERHPERALVLVDEFARTTTPREGRALLVALLQVLRARGALALAATHLNGVAREAGVTHFAIAGLHALPPRSTPPLDLAAALDLIGGAMDYRLRRNEEDEIGRADALTLAEVLGLDTDLIRRARADLSIST